MGCYGFKEWKAKNKKKWRWPPSFQSPSSISGKLEQLTQNGSSSFFAKKVWRGHQTLFLFLNNKQVHVKLSLFSFNKLIEYNFILVEIKKTRIQQIPCKKIPTSTNPFHRSWFWKKLSLKEEDFPVMH